jgi:acetylornithine deacetylase/succinyl-diaminopimelate desuccinylase-like protein
MSLIRTLQRFAPCIAILCTAGPAAAQAPSSDPTAALLQELIRANSSNPPGNERRVAEVLLPHFRALGIDAKIIATPDSTKGVFIARLKGDGSKRPVLIAAHEDVVGVEREKWSVDPFAGVEKDGHIYGRGAVDFKGGMAVFARAVIMLAEQKIPLARDVIFVGEADEEGGGGYSTAWLAREHWDEIDAEFALNEGGWIMKAPDGHVRYVSVSTADKLSLPLKITAHGTSTHSSMPRPDNAIFALSRAMAKISEYETPIVLTPEQRQFFLTLAKTSTPPMSTYYRDLVGDNAAKAQAADKIVSKDPLMHSLVRNTIAATIINGGFRANVIPGSAEANINLRMIPGSDPAELIATLKRIVADTSIQFTLNAPTYPRNAPSPTTTDLYRALEKSAKAVFPGVEVTPYLFQAGTDAGAWRSKGVPVYGIYPYPIDDDELSRMHGNDEKVSIASLKQGTDMIYRTLLEVAGKKAASP